MSVKFVEVLKGFEKQARTHNAWAADMKVDMFCGVICCMLFKMMLNGILLNILLLLLCLQVSWPHIN